MSEHLCKAKQLYIMEFVLLPPQKTQLIKPNASQAMYSLRAHSWKGENSMVEEIYGENSDSV